MTDTRIEEVLFDINGKLAGIQTKLDTLSDVIVKHESRITVVEQKLDKHLVEVSTIKVNKSDDNFKNDLIKLLAKALLIGVTAVASLTGAAGILQKIFNV